MSIILLIILCLFILTGLWFGIILLLTWLTRLVIDTDKKESFRQTKKFTKPILTISIFISAGLICYSLFSNPATNFKTAYIEKRGDIYQVTVSGKRNLMTHDPISIFKKNTYVDSFKFEIPRPSGIIEASELPIKRGSYKFTKDATIVIFDDIMIVKLLYDNLDNKTIDKSPWNGEYNLQWKSGR